MVVLYGKGVIFLLKNIFKHLIRTIAIIIAFIIVVTVGVQLIYYREKENISVESLDFIDNNSPLYLTAHRGVTAYAPENSLPAFKKAKDMGYYAAECDIMLTKDNIWVITHDNTMFLHFWSFKNVSDTNYSELKKISYKNGVNILKHQNIYMPTLDEYLDILKNTDTKAQIEIKSQGTDYLDEVLKKLEERDIKSNSMIISFNFEQLNYIRAADKEIELWYLTETINDDVISEYRQLGDNAKLGINGTKNSDEQIKSALDKNVSLAAWTINDETELERLYNLGIRYITTDVFCN